MGTCTITLRKKSGLAPTGTAVLVDVALSNSYATGGDTLSAASLTAVAALPVRKIEAVNLCSSATTPGGHSVEVIYGATETTAPLLRVRDVATGVEITATTNLSAQSVRAIVLCDLVNP